MECSHTQCGIRYRFPLRLKIESGRLGRLALGRTSQQRWANSDPPSWRLRKTPQFSTARDTARRGLLKTATAAALPCHGDWTRPPPLLGGRAWTGPSSGICGGCAATAPAVAYLGCPTARLLFRLFRLFAATTQEVSC